MILKWGTYAHANTECTVLIEVEPQFDERDKRCSMRRRWTIRGELTGATQAALTTAIADLETAYAQDGLDLLLFLSDGTTPSAHGLVSAQSLGGTRVVKGPSFPKGDGADYVTYRAYEIVVEADFPVTSENLISWTETLSSRGVAGAERWLYLPTLNGPWQRQTVNEQTSTKVIQRGTAVGQFSYPAISPPMWSANEHIDERELDLKMPTRKGPHLTLYEVSWAYHFESMTPLTGTPAVP